MHVIGRNGSSIAFPEQHGQSLLDLPIFIPSQQVFPSMHCFPHCIVLQQEHVVPPEGVAQADTSNTADNVSNGRNARSENKVI